MVDEELLYKTLAGFTAIEDDGYLLDNGYLKHISSDNFFSAGNFIEYKALKDFTFNGITVLEGNRVNIYSDGSILVK
jgi:hypothetical protein